MRLHTLPSIGLVELESQAALLTRVDRKYLLSSADAEDLVNGLDSGCRVLEIGRRRASSYASTYFDTPQRDSYRSTATGRRRRWKVRIRTYLDTGDSWVEVKTRGSRGRTVKERAPLPPDTRVQLPPLAVAFVEDRLRQARAIDRPWRARPALHTAYHRSTLLLADGSTRATLDTGLRWSLPDGTRLQRDDLVILETKTVGAPSALDRALWAAGHRPIRLSKFATGLALLDPTLPANRWHRLLTGNGALAR